jgi:hypothetical protein
MISRKYAQINAVASRGDQDAGRKCKLHTLSRPGIDAAFPARRLPLKGAGTELTPTPTTRSIGERLVTGIPLEPGTTPDSGYSVRSTRSRYRFLNGWQISIPASSMRHTGTGSMPYDRFFATHGYRKMVTFRAHRAVIARLDSRYEHQRQPALRRCCCNSRKGCALRQGSDPERYTTAPSNALVKITGPWVSQGRSAFER